MSKKNAKRYTKRRGGVRRQRQHLFQEAV